MNLVSHDDVRQRIFRSDNDYQIPALDARKQATFLPAPVLCWNENKGNVINGGTALFYTWDTRFSGIVTRPEKLINSGCSVLIEPNFTITDDTPFPEALFKIYQKRYLARLCQDFDITILVDLYVVPRYADLNLMGVPRGWRAYATRGNTHRIQELHDEFLRACDHAERDDILFVVYGGGAKIRDWCYAHAQVTFLPEVAMKRRQQQIVRTFYDGTLGQDRQYVAWVDAETQAV